MIDVDLQWVGLEEAVTNTPVQSLRHVVTPFLRKRGEGQLQRNKCYGVKLRPMPASMNTMRDEVTKARDTHAEASQNK
jgi:hypothetical protein